MLLRPARRVLAGLLAMVTLCGATALTQAQTQVAAAPDRSISVEDLSNRVWAQAKSGEREQALDLVRAIPADAASPALASLRSISALYDQNRAKQETARAERIAIVEKELGEALAKPKAPDTLSAALKSAVELSMLSLDKPAFLKEARIEGLIKDADAAAKSAEAAGEWLSANELFYRLNLLLDEAGTYRDDVKRLTHRLTMIRLYVPERLWEMRNAQRRAEGKDPLPAFNALGEDLKTKLEGINREMVLAAIERAAVQHVDREHIARRDLILGGLDFIRTLVTTTDLQPVFTGIADAAARQRMLDFITDRERKLQASGRLSRYETEDTLKDLLQINRESVDLPAAAVLREFGDGAMARLDEYSTVFWPADVPRFERMYKGELKGVGIQIQMDEASQLIKVVTPLEGTPAQRAGVRPGDLIKKVGGEPALGMSLTQAVELITGAPGTTVKITMEREGKDIDFELVRATIPLRSVKGWKRLGAKEDQWEWFIDRENKVGYIRLTGFQEDSTRELDRAIDEMKSQGLAGLILDLRFNPGGLLTQAVSVANFFIPKGTIVSTTGERSAPEQALSARARLKDIPVAVLINEGSASASEIVSGAIRHYADTGEIHAILIGDRSYGKGSVQNVYDLPGGAAMKLTTQYYKLPGGQIIHRLPGAKEWGVEPHVKVPMLPEQISQALTLRQDADVVPIDQEGHVIQGATPPPDPEKLLTDGLDLQLEYALVLLRTQTIPGSMEQARINN